MYSPIEQNADKYTQHGRASGRSDELFPDLTTYVLKIENVSTAAAFTKFSHFSVPVNNGI